MPPSAHFQFDPPVQPVRDLMLEYAAQLGIDLCFQNFERELLELPGKYARPEGALLLVSVSGEEAGCGAYRPWTDKICEMKRVYLRPAYRGCGIGKQMVTLLMAEAAQAGYCSMRLDTLASSMRPAIALYESLGFHPIEPYYKNTITDFIYLEAALTPFATNSFTRSANSFDV